MFCKICSDSGKIGFNTHNVRDSNGNVVCPVLLSTVCRNCGLSGHTVKYCTSNNNHVKKLPCVSFYDQVKQPLIMNAKSKSKSKSNLNIYNYLDQWDECDECDDDCMNYDLDNIIWGVGQKDMIGVLWADVC
jgi:hypothetical protein